MRKRNKVCTGPRGVEATAWRIGQHSYVQVSKAERVGAGVGWNLNDLSRIGFIEKTVLVGICRR